MVVQALQRVYGEFSTVALLGSCRLLFLTILPLKLTNEGQGKPSTAQGGSDTTPAMRSTGLPATTH